MSFRVDESDVEPQERGDYWCFVIDEYAARTASTIRETSGTIEHFRRLARGPDASVPMATRSYLDAVHEDDLFWVVGAREADENPSWHPPPLGPAPYLHAIFLSGSRHRRLRERDGAPCRVYAVEERSAGKGKRKPARYGIRFLDEEDSHWVVPADEIALAPMYP